MRLRRAAAIVLFLIASLTASLAIAAVQDSPPRAESLARQTLGPNDGWASFSGGTTGGAAATADHVYTVTNRQELVAALAAGSTAKIVFVSGTIDANVDASNQPLPCGAYAVPAYSLEAFLATYDPAADRFISRFNGTAIFADGTFVNGHSRADAIDVVAAYNAVRDPDLSPAVSWKPVLLDAIDPTQSLPGQVGHGAGPFAVQ